MNSDKSFIIVYHLSPSGEYLTEVKRYQSITYARKWAVKHPDAKVYALCALPQPHGGYHPLAMAEFWNYGTQQHFLSREEWADLPERLDSR